MSPGIRPSVHGLSPCTQFMEGVIFYTVIKHQISLYRRTIIFSSETHQNLFSSLIASALKEITQFAGTSYEVTSTIDYTLMPMGLHQKKWSTNCEVHLCSVTILFPSLKLEGGTLLFISVINHVSSHCLQAC